MEEKFLVSGGIPRVLGELIAGHVFKKAELAEIDFSNKTYTKVFTYKTPKEYCSDTLPSITFGCFFTTENELFIPTRTEVLILDKNSYIVKEIIRDPLFNDIHSVVVLNNQLYVAVTGLDAVYIYDLIKREREVINVLGKDAFHKYKPSDNLNKRASLKPHEAHPNQLFILKGEVWVTRLIAKDAICINDASKRINIGIGSPHDGIVKDNLVYFTTVNGYVVVSDAANNYSTKTIKLSGSKINEEVPLGWCRGLFVGETHFYVGFTQLRTTKLTENLDWVKTMLKKKEITNKPLPTRIEKYTLNGEYVSEFKLPKDGIYNVFSIHKI